MRNKLLLDTHILLWWLENDNKLKKVVKDIISDEKNQIFVNVVNFWEISVKNRKGKLLLKSSLKTIIKESKFEILNINTNHILALDFLPRDHNDPFDRLLIAQAKAEKLKLVTADQKIWKYKVAVVKA